jgi:D-arginine dehydrogenase
LSETYDIAVVGAGMAGASIAAELAPHARVVLLEAEAQPGYHSTGRSAAFWEECFGGPLISPLTLASGPFLREHDMLSPRGALYVGRAQDQAKIDAFMQRFSGSGVTIEQLTPSALQQRVPGIRPEWCLAISEPACADIDVARLHQFYLARAREGGAELRCAAQVERLERTGGEWFISLSRTGEVRAGVLVDAAGAWADRVAAMAGVRPRGITPLRRTVAQLRTDPSPPHDLPLVLDISGGFYFKPEHGRVWLSPQDETPCPASDAAPEELDVAVAIDRFERVVDWRIEAVEHKWAGLRSFAPDRLPVYGFDDEVEGFFWFAGQGGFGIQTAPAAARLGSQRLLGLPPDAMTGSLDPGLYVPDRFS